MSKFSLHFLYAATLIFGLNGCGGGGSSTDNTSSTTKKSSYFIDSAVEGLNYECDGQNGITDSKGTLLCDRTPIVIKLGEMELGSVNSFTSDSKIYPQDLLGLPRDNFSDEKLIKLIRLLQSLDDDGDINQTINITNEVSEFYTADLNFDQSMLEILAAPLYGDLVEKESAIAHLQDSMGLAAHIASSTNEENGEATDPEETINDIASDLFDDNNVSDATEDNESEVIEEEEIETVEF